MGRGKPIILDTKCFDTQKQALAFFQEILKRYIPGERITPEDEPHLASLLKRHVDYSAKVGCGIDHFEVMDGGYGTQCFCVVRNDGSKEGFSYPRCITLRWD